MKQNLCQYSQYQQIYGSCDNTNNDLEMNGQGFFELEMRLGFIRKVYGILSAQMLLTTFMCILSISIPSLAKFQIENPMFMYLSLMCAVAISIALCCCRQLSRKVPINYILLGSFTFCKGYIVSAICATTKPEIVLMAAFMTCGITIALTYYACTTKSDFTVLNSLLFICSCVMFMFGVFLMFSHVKILHIIYSCAGILLYSLYLVFDTQLIMGDKTYSLEIDDYIYGALMLYIDIIGLFLRILKLLKETDS
jgi:FtsH-binding integral membrane protein